MPVLPLLAISAVSEETGVPISVLRTWERRYGFPTPMRSPSGHRRYSPEQVEEIRRVLRDRESGTTLDAAMRRARSRPDVGEASIFAGLRRRWPQLEPFTGSPRAMLAISNAIEDECLVSAERPLLIGAFQHERHFRRAERRWRELARTARRTVAMAELTGNGARADTDSGIELVPLPPDVALRREWAIVCDAPSAAACLAGIERPSSRSGLRRFEVVWSADQAVVRDAAHIAISIAAAAGATVDASELAPLDTDHRAALRHATALTNRIVGYLDDDRSR